MNTTSNVFKEVPHEVILESETKGKISVNYLFILNFDMLLTVDFLH